MIIFAYVRKLVLKMTQGPKKRWLPWAEKTPELLKEIGGGV
jgi:hypothetical protein